ncbi:MAG TPA: hypothetical protein VN030_11900 [Cellvibrio sp.]|nr:hypothetical protein [Cellvibrio sp.]
MRYKYLLIAFVFLCTNANAEWFLRGTQNSWEATPMESAGAGTNTVQLKGVAFATAGSIKFDRFGDWSENYGVGGRSGTDVPVAAGNWDIKFFTDTKNWNISAAQISSSSLATSSSLAASSSLISSSAASSTAASIYHLRGTFNSWQEGTRLNRVGNTDNYEYCVNFVGGDTNGGPRFKIDPNGGWGDAIPSADFVVAAGWVKVTFNSISKAISVQQNLPANCVIASSSVAVSSSVQSSAISSSTASSAPASIYHLRGTFNSWQEGTLLNRVGNTDNYDYCVNFVGGDTNGGPRFKIDPNGAWGDAIPAADFTVSAGWLRISFNSTSKAISVQQNLSTSCAIASSSVAISSVATSSSVKSSVISSSSVASSTAASIYHLRGTFNSWQEGTLLNRVGNTDNYDYCVNFVGGDTNGGPRFKIDPNGAWGDAIPAADFAVSAGWVRISFNSTSKAISVQQNLSASCAIASSSVATSSVATSSSVKSSAISSAVASSAPASIYHVRGTFNSWQEGTLLNRVGNTDNYDYCVNFVAGDTNGGPRFKIDPNGAWGDAIPAADFVVSAGWVRINFNSTSKAISVQQNLPANCAATSSSAAQSSVAQSSAASSAPASIYHLRGTFNSWLEGTLLNRVGNTDTYEYCVNFVAGDSKGGPRFKIDPNGAWGDAIPAADFTVSAGWVKVSFNSISKAISVQQNLPANCGAAAN